MTFILCSLTLAPRRERLLSHFPATKSVLWSGHHVHYVLSLGSNLCLFRFLSKCSDCSLVGGKGSAYLTVQTEFPGAGVQWEFQSLTPKTRGHAWPRSDYGCQYHLHGLNF